MWELNTNLRFRMGVHGYITFPLLLVIYQLFKGDEMPKDAAR